MDIYGLNPKIIQDKPIEPSENPTQDEIQSYLQALSDWKSKNLGAYFRSNIWSWMVILAVSEIAIKVVQLPLSTKGWGGNDGYGLKTQEECDMLADAIEIFLTLNKQIKDDEDKMFIVTSMWVDSNGRFLSKDVSKKLSDTYKQGTIMYNHVVLENGTLACPVSSTTKLHIKYFVDFLRYCGGFEIC